MVKDWRIPSVSVIYFLTKANSVLLGLIFSILYSRALGPESKGVLTVVFLSTVLFSQIINGGINLSFRSRLNGIHPEHSAPEYFTFSILSSMLVTVITLFILQIYSMTKVPLASNYFVISIGFVFLAILAEQMTQFILSLRNFDSLWKIELPTIPIQMSIYFALINFSSFSTAFCVLLSFSFSYLILIIRSLKVILKSESLNRSHVMALSKVFQLIRISKNNLFYNLLLSLTDKLDRLIVVWVFSTALFGKYSLATGIMVAVRFLPETIGNLILGNRATNLQRIFKKFKLQIISTMLIGIVISVFAIRAFIEYFMGDIWVIGIPVMILFGFSELFRGVYIVQVNKLLYGGKRHTAHLFAALFILCIGIFTGLVAFLSDNIAIVPTGMLLGYFLVTLRLTFALRASARLGRS